MTMLEPTDVDEMASELERVQRHASTDSIGVQVNGHNWEIVLKYPYQRYQDGGEDNE